MPLRVAKGDERISFSPEIARTLKLELQARTHKMFFVTWEHLFPFCKHNCLVWLVSRLLYAKSVL